MSQNLVTANIRIEGMSCVNCEHAIERKLKNLHGVKKVNVSYSSGLAKLTFDSSQIALADIEKMIEKMGYQVRRAGDGIDPSPVKLAGAIIIFLSLFMMLSRTGIFNLFNLFPEAEAGMSYGMLFVIGLLTSLHCVAMCGGINLSQCVSYQTTSESRWDSLLPAFLYNGGRVLSYTIVGALVGALGSVVSFSGAAKGMVQLLAGVFMIIMGLNMLNVFPQLRQFNLRMPKFFARTISEEKGKRNSPFYIGLLNGLMPCGPLQAMQLYALSTGSPLKGALAMFLFSLGTVPLMLGLGAISTLLTKKFTAKMMTASAVLVTVLGVFMLRSGMALAGLGSPVPTPSGSSVNAVQAPDGIQEITTNLTAGRYEAITVQAGVPVRWTIHAEPGTINGCNNRLVIPEYDNLTKKLEVGDNIIEFTPTKTGTFPYSCWMGMIRSSITVVAAGEPVPETQAVAVNGRTTTANQVAPNNLLDTAGGCCAGSSLAGDFANGNIPTDEIQVAEMIDGVQVATVTVNEYGYSPAVIVLEKDQDFILRFEPENINGCNQIVYFPEFGGGIDLTVEQETPVLSAGTDFSFQCSMNMLHGYVKVVDDIENVDLEAVKADVENFEPASSGTGGCCG